MVSTIYGAVSAVDVYQCFWMAFLFHEGVTTKPKIFDLCEALWSSGYIEESFIACNWSYYLHEQYEPSDFKVFEKWINQYVNNWDFLMQKSEDDTICPMELR